MLLGLRAEAQLVDVVDDLAQVVAALNLVLDLAEDLPDFVFDGVRPGGPGLEAVQVAEQFAIDEGQQVIAGHGGIVIEFAVFALGCGPARPAVGFVEGGFGGFVVLQGVEVFQEQQPGGLPGVIEFAGAAGIFPEDVINVFEGLFEHDDQAAGVGMRCGRAMGRGVFQTVSTAKEKARNRALAAAS